MLNSIIDTIQMALPGELAKHAISEALKATSKADGGLFSLSSSVCGLQVCVCVHMRVLT